MKVTRHTADPGILAGSAECANGIAQARGVRVALLVLPLMLLCVSEAGADQVTVSGENFPDSRITRLQGGKLHFRAADGKSRIVWISDVDLIIVDRGGVFGDFNQAERLLARGDPEKAIVRYRRTLRLTDAFWSDLIAARLLVACDRAGRLDQATLNFVRVVRGKACGAAIATRMIPATIPSKRTPAAMRAVQHLDGALQTNPTDEARIPLTLFRFLILSRTGDGRADEAAKTVARITVPESHRCPVAYNIKLAAFERLSATALQMEELSGLDRAIRDCPEELLPGFLLLKGKALLQTASRREDMIRATWPLMRVVAHMPNDALAADGLYQTSLALERIGRRDKAVDLLRECLAHGHVRQDTEQLAKAALARLKHQ